MKKIKPINILQFVLIVLVAILISYLLLKRGEDTNTNETERCSFIFIRAEDKLVHRGYESYKYTPKEINEAVDNNDWTKVEKITIQERNKNIVDSSSADGYYIIDKNQTWVWYFNGRSTEVYGPYQGYPCK